MYPPITTRRLLNYYEIWTCNTKLPNCSIRNTGLELQKIIYKSISYLKISDSRDRHMDVE